MALSRMDQNHLNNTLNAAGQLKQDEKINDIIQHEPPAIGILARNGIVLVVYIPPPKKDSLEVSYNYRASSIKSHNGMIFSGPQIHHELVWKRVRDASLNHLKYCEASSLTQFLAKDVGEYIQQLTMDNGFRPLAISLMFGGYDEGQFSLYLVDYRGSPQACRSVVLGRKQHELQSYIQRNISSDMLLYDATRVALLALRDVYRYEISEDNLQMVHITEGGYEQLNRKKISSFIHQFL